LEFFLFLLHQVLKPIPVEADRLTSPGASYVDRWKLRKALWATIRKRSRLQKDQGRCGILVEIASWHGRVKVTFPGEESPDISPVFEQ
jgi:hypothetical protein